MESFDFTETFESKILATACGDKKEDMLTYDVLVE